jgi:hypothetical protein
MEEFEVQLEKHRKPYDSCEMYVDIFKHELFLFKGDYEERIMSSGFEIIALVDFVGDHYVWEWDRFPIFKRTNKNAKIINLLPNKFRNVSNKLTSEEKLSLEQYVVQNMKYEIFQPLFIDGLDKYYLLGMEYICWEELKISAHKRRSYIENGCINDGGVKI